MKRRDMKYVVSALQAAKPMLAIEVSDLDKDDYLLNVTAATYNLMHGMEGAKEPESEDYITKQTTCAPGNAGKQLWLDALDIFFCKDQALIDYVQQIVGMTSVEIFLWIRNGVPHRKRNSTVPFFSSPIVFQQIQGGLSDFLNELMTLRNKRGKILLYGDVLYCH